MITKVVKRKISEYWQYKCAVCDRNDYLEFHHLIPLSEGGTDDYDNIILLCARCHAVVHGRSFDPTKPNCKTSIDYETAKPILASYFANEIGARETKEKLKLSQKTHLTESSLYKRYKREHNIGKFYNNVLEIPTTTQDLSSLDNSMAKMIMETINNMLIELYATIAQAEIEKKEKRQREGIQTKKDRGEWDDYGRPKAQKPDNWDEVIDKWQKGEITAVKAMAQTGLKKTTFYELVKEEAAEQ